MYEIGKREIEAVAKVIRGGMMFRYRGGEGGWCDHFEEALAEKIGVKHALTVSSGTGALICALVGAGVEPEDEVIVPAYTFMATPLAVLAMGAIPIIADVDETLSLSPQAVEKCVSKHTRAVIPVHMIGRPCNMDALKRIAGRHKLLLIEDACQAVGGSYRGRRLGSIGDAGAFSFNQFKIISAGEGGAVVTDDLTAYDKALIYHDGGCVFRKHADKVSTPFFAGSNFRVSEITGAIMFEQLKRLDGILKRLRAHRAALRNALAKQSTFRFSPCNEEDGDCGVSAPVIFEKEQEAKQFVERNSSGNPFGPHRPIDTGRHVYVNWTPLLEKHGAFHPKADPYRRVRRKIRYSKDMCRSSLDILARTVTLTVPYDMTVKEIRRAAKSLDCR